MKEIPVFKTEEEEIKFWESHSIADYWYDLENGKDIFKKEVINIWEVSLWQY